MTDAVLRVSVLILDNTRASDAGSSHLEVSGTLLELLPVCRIAVVVKPTVRYPILSFVIWDLANC